MTKIYIAAPGPTVSGGPEVLHQLGDSLNRHTRRAWMLYYPFDKPHQTPDAYQRYNVKHARLGDVEPGSIVILPEVCAALTDRFSTAQIYFWWLSVDNFMAPLRDRPLGILRARRLARKQLGKLRERVACHMYQSEYARRFLEAESLGPAVHLADYLAEEYVHAAARPRQEPRENIVVYNPAKGWKRTKLILRALQKSGRPMPQVVPIEGMTRNAVYELLERAKVYLDFGAHPGKDRIPREAVALGACTLVNRRGSAANAVDIPIPQDLKIDDRQRDFEKLAAEKIHMLMDDFEHQVHQFDDYRESIALEPKRFLDDVRSVFPEGL
jgi:hypothetical protein